MYLEHIKQPTDIKNLNITELKLLAREIRKRIIDVVSTNGGHIGPSLGTVELTIALLKVFTPPVDQIVWDVGHQAYAWKILTGRNDRFDTLRTYGGLSGFTNRSESPCDPFGTGHSSTSISAALGMACARDLTGGEGNCVAVIGDGALTGGMSFEALNHAGHLQKDKFIVILNDNAMSISRNVGGLQRYMARMLVSKPYNILKKQVWDKSTKLPDGVRRRFILGAQKLEESLINILVPRIIFEDLGLKYVGPIDGHNIPTLLSILHNVKHNLVGPVLVHVVTKKGKGYTPAEQDAPAFHGVGPFEIESGKAVSSGAESWSEVMGKHLVHLAAQQPNIVAITAAMSAGTGLTKFEQTYPERFYDVGIAEQHAVTFAAGLAAKGIKPFFAVYSTFLQRALDQVIHDVALQKLPVVFCLDRAGLVGEDGATHHGAFDISFLNCVPNLTILAPSTAGELTAMLTWAAAYQDGPVVIRYPRGAAIHLGKAIRPFLPGKAEIISKGKDLAFISIGGTLTLAKDIVHLLEQAGLNPWQVNARSIKPLDTELYNKLAKTCKYLFTLEANTLTGGFGSALRAALGQSEAKVVSFGYPDQFIPHGKIDQLNASIGFTAEAISEKIITLLKVK